METKHTSRPWRIDNWGVPNKQNAGSIIYTTNGILKGADDEHIIVFNRDIAELIVKAVNAYDSEIEKEMERVKKDGGEAYLNGFNDGVSQMQAEIEKLQAEMKELREFKNLWTYGK